jgi:hypothetical protein
MEKGDFLGASKNSINVGKRRNVFDVVIRVRIRLIFLLLFCNQERGNFRVEP